MSLFVTTVSDAVSTTPGATVMSACAPEVVPLGDELEFAALSAVSEGVTPGQARIHLFIVLFASASVRS